MKLSTIEAKGRRNELGAWVTGIPGAEDLELCVRAFGNGDYERRQAELFAAAPAAEKPGGKLTPEANKRISLDLLATAVLVDWRNLTDDAGTPIAFSPERALALLSDDASLFRSFVAWAAGNVTERGRRDDEAAAKN
ncbi:MAG: hypothetical protein DI565_00675 [Ancylobacter novellus]|uniref:Tail assembly chaperone n=1 Tax=Ancylobacter novellus TaxID=921 RepID=A0A2W5KPF5_ANCNO|nr:MAG: hypothetical protein DI565_00675 [Ancylobacter novellus]